MRNQCRPPFFPRFFTLWLSMMGGSRTGFPLRLVRDTAHKARGGSVPMCRHRSTDRVSSRKPSFSAAGSFRGSRATDSRSRGMYMRPFTTSRHDHPSALPPPSLAGRDQRFDQSHSSSVQVAWISQLAAVRKRAAVLTRPHRWTPSSNQATTLEITDDSYDSRTLRTDTNSVEPTTATDDGCASASARQNKTAAQEFLEHAMAGQ